MELAAQLEARSATMELLWIPRDQNSEADRLADSDFGGFTPSLRVAADLADVRFLVLHDLLEAGQAWHDDAAERGRAGRGSGAKRPGGEGVAHAQPGRFVLGVRGPKRQKLREREPW